MDIWKRANLIRSIASFTLRHPTLQPSAWYQGGADNRHTHTKNGEWPVEECKTPLHKLQSAIYSYTYSRTSCRTQVREKLAHLSPGEWVPTFYRRCVLRNMFLQVHLSFWASTIWCGTDRVCLGLNFDPVNTHSARCVYA